jgi:hypothetical protein
VFNQTKGMRERVLLFFHFPLENLIIRNEKKGSLIHNDKIKDEKVS